MTNSLRPLSALCAALAVLFAGPAYARNVVADAKQIATVLEGKGRTVEIKDTEGSNLVRVSGATYDYSIVIYGCDEARRNCKSIQFYAAYNPKKSPTLKALNAYARDNRWGRFYLDQEDDPVVEFDVDLEQGGMSEALFLDNLEYWETVISVFGDFVFGPDGKNNGK